MSKTIKFTLSDEYYDKLVKMSDESGKNLQDYIRSVIFPEEEGEAITLEKAIALALEYGNGEQFTVPSLFGDSWNLRNGYAGIFGRRFCELVDEKYSDRIIFTGKFDQYHHAIYERVEIV